MSHRRIEGLGFAQESEGPKCFTAKRRRPRGAKGAGVKFEKMLANAFGVRARWGQWFRFADLNGMGYAQTDLLLFARDEVIVFECKLGNIWAGEAQARELYKPILEHVYGLPCRCVVVARHLTDNPFPERVAQSLPDAIRLARTGISVLQWRERLPLVVPPGLGPNPHNPAPQRLLAS